MANITIYARPRQSETALQQGQKFPPRFQKNLKKGHTRKSPIERFLNSTAGEGSLDMVAYGLDRHPGILRPKTG
jgi:hypothetical protein